MQQVQLADCQTDGTIQTKIDLTRLVHDDELLVSLFVERLKLAYEGSPSEDTVTKQIKRGLIREQEILQQLEELE